MYTTQTLTRKQLLQLRGKHTCSDWNNKINEILKEHWNIEENIPISQEILDYASKNATKEQLEDLEVVGLTFSKQIKIEDIDYYTACQILKIHQYIAKDFFIDYQWNEYQLATIIKAVNYIDNNNKEWKPDFNDKNQYKYYPYGEKLGGKWRLCYVYFSLGNGNGAF